MAPPSIPIPLFAQTQLNLLQQEHEADVSSSSLANTAASVSPSTRRTLQATGYALTGLILAQCRTGLGGRVVGEFTADPAMVPKGSKNKDKQKESDEKEDSRSGSGEVRLGPHGIRVGDVVRVNDVAGPGGKKAGKEKDKDNGKDGGAKGLEGVVTRVGERSVWIAFGQRGGNTGGRSKEDDEAIEELWGKKLWWYVSFSRLDFEEHGSC